MASMAEVAERERIAEAERREREFAVESLEVERFLRELNDQRSRSAFEAEMTPVKVAEVLGHLMERIRRLERVRE